MRIITGKARGIKLKTLEGDNTRPTAERVKEAVFSMIQFDIEGRQVLDLFAGSGQMALEALSRGASGAVLVDRSKDAVKIIRDNVEKTKLQDDCHIVNSDYLDYIKRNSGKKFDIIFLDPPYRSENYVPSLTALYENDILKPTSIVVCECGEDYLIENDKKILKYYSIKKQSKYSKSVITILEPKIAEKKGSVAIVPGSFDPITYGHIEIAKRAAEEYETVYLAVMVNSQKNYLFTLDERKKIAEAALAQYENIKVISSDGMLWQLAYDLGAEAIVKGYRNQTDLDYEMKMAEFNKKHNPNAKTVLLKSSEEYEDISSTLVRSRIAEGLSLDGFVPEKATELVYKYLKK